MEKSQRFTRNSSEHTFLPMRKTKLPVVTPLRLVIAPTKLPWLDAMCNHDVNHYIQLCVQTSPMLDRRWCNEGCKVGHGKFGVA